MEQLFIALHNERITDITIVTTYLKKFLLDNIGSATVYKNPRTNLPSDEPTSTYVLKDLLADLEPGIDGQRTYVHVIDFLWDMNYTTFIQTKIYPLYRHKNVMYSLVDLINILTNSMN